MFTFILFQKCSIYKTDIFFKEILVYLYFLQNSMLLFKKFQIQKNMNVHFL